jgi:hypothetical protein
MNKGETHLMASAQSIDDLAISGICLIVLRAVCMMRMASPHVLIAVGGIFRYLRNQDICFNAYTLEFTLIVI